MSEHERLQQLVRIARDGVGFYDAARDAIDDAALRDLFRRMAAAKLGLIEVLGRRLGDALPAHGTPSGALRRTYARIRASVLQVSVAEWLGALEAVEERLLQQFGDALQAIDDDQDRLRLLAALPRARACHAEMRTIKRRVEADGHDEENTMNMDRIEGNWKQLKGRMRAKWGELTDDDLDVAAGNREHLVGKLQERYGIARDQAEQRVDEFERSL